MRLTRTVVVVFFCLGLNANAQPPTWRTLPNAPVTAGKFEDASFVSPLVGWVVGASKIYKTMDGGGSWQVQMDTSFGYRSVGFADSLRGWVGTLSADSTKIFFSTTDGGETWVAVQNIPEPRPSGICGICVVNDSVVYACGRFSGPARIIRSPDAGATWVSMDLSQYASTLVDCYFLSPDSGFVVGGIGTFSDSTRAVILFTSNGGNTWQTRHTTSLAKEWCWKISFPSRNTGYVSVESFGGNAGRFLKTTDGGMTWADEFAAGIHIEGIGFSTDSLGWIGGLGSSAYETTDGGESWHSAGFGVSINRFRMLSDTLGYAVGETVYKYSIEPAVGVDEPEGELASQYSLAQNYPNPFNPSTSIEFYVPQGVFVNLKIFNVQGVEVATLIGETLGAGLHVARWEPNDVASGVYFYRLEAGEFVETKKILLIR